MLMTQKIDMVLIMSYVYNYESNLQVLTDILGNGGYSKQPGHIDLFIASDNL